MKKFFLMTLVAGIAMIFASCGKEVNLAGTSWHADETYTKQLVVSGITADCVFNFDVDLNFTDATTGTMNAKYSGTITAMGQEHPVPDGGGTDSFTYTFDGENGVLYSTDPNETETIPFTYDKKEKMIVINLDFDNSDEMPGLEFHIPLHFKRQ